MERVVLVDDEGRPVGVADKATVHGASTPRHLAFSCYGFGPDGRLLVTRRAATKIAFPLVWTNTCCGHPAPGEDAGDAVRRRMHHELGLQARDLRLLLPTFSYRASSNGIEENELCPVFACRLDGDDPRPADDEVDDWGWWDWSRFRDAAADPDSGLSPWSREQVPHLEALHDPLFAARP